MTEEELRQTLHTLGWSLQLRSRRATGKRYAYAKRKRSGKVQTRYICPEDKIDQLDRQFVERKLMSVK